MALVKGNSEHPPANSVRLSKEQAIDFQLNRLERWRNQSQVWYLINGSYVLSGISAVTSGVILNFFRWRLRLDRTVRLSSYAPTMFIPAVTNLLAQEMYVKGKLLIQETCPVCLEIRSALAQLGCGILQPTLLSMLITISVSKETSSYSVPEFKPANPTKYYKFLGKLFRDAKPRYIGAILVHLFASSYIIYKQLDELEILNQPDAKISEFC